MSKKKIASTVALVAAFCSIAGGLNWIAARNGLVSDLSPFWFTSEAETADVPEIGVSETGILCGRVVQADGDGISNARVHLRGEGYGGKMFDFTDSEGRFAFEDVPVGGSYRLTVRANGLVFTKPSVTLEGATCEDEVRFAADPFN